MGGFFLLYLLQSLAKKLDFFQTQFGKHAPALFIAKVQKCVIPHLKDLKVIFNFQYQTFQNSQGYLTFRLDFENGTFQKSESGRQKNEEKPKWFGHFKSSMKGILNMKFDTNILTYTKVIKL